MYLRVAYGISSTVSDTDNSPVSDTDNSPVADTDNSPVSDTDNSLLSVSDAENSLYLAQTIFEFLTRTH